MTIPRIGFTSYGHSDPTNPSRPRNAMLLVNWGIGRGVELFARRHGFEAIDFSPPLASHGIDQQAHADVSTIEPVDVLVFQGGVSLHRVEQARRLNPGVRLICQRESTHARSYLERMKAAQRRHGYEWRLGYEGPQLEHDLREYDLAEAILVPSGTTAQTFEEQGLGDRVRYCPTLIEPWDCDWSRRPPFPLTVLHAAQLGLRKGTLTVLEAWRRFRRADPRRSAVLLVAGLPEHGAPQALKDRLARELAQTPDVRQLGWVDTTRLRQAYQQSHVVLMPSVEDGATMVGYEAGWAGCAIISTFQAGIDLPRLDVAVDNPDEIVSALESLTNPERRRDYAHRAHRRVGEHHLPAHHAERIAQAIEESLP